MEMINSYCGTKYSSLFTSYIHTYIHTYNTYIQHIHTTHTTHTKHTIHTTYTNIFTEKVHFIFRNTLASHSFSQSDPVTRY